METATRLAELERTTTAMQTRLRRLEEAMDIEAPAVWQPPAPAFVAPAPVAAPAPPPAPAPAPVATPRERMSRTRTRTQLSLEDLLAGRILAWAGGGAVLVGIVLLFGIAGSRGWIGPGARVGIASAVALALGVLGVWLHERKGRTDAALAVIATSVAGLFVCDVVAARVYDLIPSVAGIVAGMAIGGCATVLALRWRAQGIAALGLCGALLAPVLAGAGATTGSLAFLFVAALCATAVCLYERWSWLGAGVLAITAAQWIVWVANAAWFDSETDVTPLLAAGWMAAFGALAFAAAIGYELRDRLAPLRSVSVYLVVINALILGFVGGSALGQLGGDLWTELWLAGLAVAHLATGFGLRGGSRAVRGLLIGIGVVLADVAAGMVLGGPALTVAWVSGAVVLRVVTRRLEGNELAAAQVGLTAQLAIALIQALAGGAAFGAAQNTTPFDLGALVSVIAVAAGCFACARLTEDRVGNPLRQLLNAAAMGLLALITAMTLHGPQLVLAWTIEAYALARVARRAPGEDVVATLGSLGFLGGAATVALVHVAPWLSITNPPEANLGAAVLGSLGVVALGCLACARLHPDDTPIRVGLDSAAIAALALIAPAALDGPLVVVAWAAEALIVVAGRRFLDERSVRGGAAALLGLALGHALAFEARPEALIVGVPDAAAAALALGAVIAAAAACAFLLRGAGEQYRPDRIVLGAGAALVALYLGSIELITAFQPNAGAVGDDLGIPIRQLGQMLLSGGWALVGLVALVVGLQRQSLPVRRAGLALLMLALSKVAIFDLATLDSFYRVLSFVALGLLLLAGAFAWQRARPKPLPDLREAPPAIR